MSLETYEFKTPPLVHQKEEFFRSTTDKARAIFWDPGLGKSYLIINQMSYLYQQGLIDTAIIVAPNGVHLNWCLEEIPKHMPDSVRAKCKMLTYVSQKAGSKKAGVERDKFIKHQGLSILFVAYEACITDKFKAFKKQVYEKRKSVFLCLDESHRIKGRTAHVRKTLTATGDRSAYRRILTGTPLETPPDLYGQVRFLERTFWESKGFPTSVEFDAHFCEYEEKSFVQRAKGGGIVRDKDGMPKRNLVQLIKGYKNIDILKEYLKEIGVRLTLEQAGIHLPPVTYSKRYYEMFPEQRRMYDDLKTKFRTEFEDGVVVDAQAAITRLLRLQQIICGYVGVEQDEPVRMIDPKKNPRLDLCLETVEDLPHQVLIWCRFVNDVSQVVDALGKEARRYDGQADEDDRLYAKQAFQAGDLKYLVLTDAGAEGLTLVGAKTSLFYSNSFTMIKRIQKEARNVRIGQTEHTSCIDLVCEGTVDNDIVDALRKKRDLASQLTGDELKSWI